MQAWLVVVDEHAYAERDRVTRVLTGTVGGQKLRFPLFKDRLTIGRTAQNDIQLKAQHVSRRHAVVVIEGAVTRVIDWGSKNSSPVTIGLPYVPAHAPKLAHSGNATRLIFHEPAQSNQKVEPFYGTNVLAYDQTGKLCWERRLANIDWQESIARNHADWPCIVDLNGDGND